MAKLSPKYYDIFAGAPSCAASATRWDVYAVLPKSEPNKPIHRVNDRSMSREKADRLVDNLKNGPEKSPRVYALLRRDR